MFQKPVYNVIYLWAFSDTIVNSWKWAELKHYFSPLGLHLRKYINLNLEEKPLFVVQRHVPCLGLTAGKWDCTAGLLALGLKEWQQLLCPVKPAGHFECSSAHLLVPCSSENGACFLKLINCFPVIKLMINVSGQKPVAPGKVNMHLSPWRFFYFSHHR